MSDVLAWFKLHGGAWGVFITAVGALSGPPVLAYLPTKWAGALIVVGTLITAFSRPVVLPGRTIP